MAPINGYRELIVWRKSIDWVVGVYQLSKRFPRDERFGLTSQLRRSATSVASNIAEGAARSATGDFLQSLSVASGSLAEAETQLVLAERLEFLEAGDCRRLHQKAEEINRMLTALKRTLRAKGARNKNQKER